MGEANSAVSFGQVEVHEGDPYRELRLICLYILLRNSARLLVAAQARTLPEELESQPSSLQTVAGHWWFAPLQIAAILIFSHLSVSKTIRHYQPTLIMVFTIINHLIL